MNALNVNTAMNSTFSKFQQDLALEREFTRSNGDDHIVLADNHSKKPAENEGGRKTLGLAIMVIFQAKRSALRKAMADLESDSAVSSSLQSLISHAMAADTDDQEQLATARIREVRLMTQALGDELAPSSDKKRKLAALIAIEDAINIQNRPKSANGKEGTLKSKEPSKKDRKSLSKCEQTIGTTGGWEDSFEMDGAFCNNSSKRWVDGTRTMTRLTSLAMEVAIEVSRILAIQTLQEIKDAEDKERAKKPALVMEIDSQEDDKMDVDTEETQPFSLGFVRSMKSMHTVIKYYLLSDHSQVDIITVGMTDVLDMLVRFNRHHSSGKIPPSREIVFSFAQSWKLISDVLVKKKAALSDEEISKQVQKYSQMNEIPPYLRLLTTGLLLGYCGPLSQIDSVLNAPDELRPTLLGLANVVVLENIPVGQATAIAMQTHLIPSLNETMVQDMKNKIIAVLDTPSEISQGLANVASSYMTIYPEIFVPALLTRLRHQERGSTPSKDRANLRTTLNLLHELETLVIDMFREKDISIRVAMGQIVVYLNPVKVIGIYGPEINSSSGMIRSNAESILVECMLAQRQDTSLGDGFGVFLEYIRHVGHSIGSQESNLSKVKTPAELVARLLPPKPNSTPSNSQVEFIDKLLRVIKALGEVVPMALWGEFISELSAKTIGSPSDGILGRVWAQLAPSIVKSPEAIIFLFKTLSKIMEQQDVLTEEALESALEVSDEAFDDLRLSRLVPLNILKVIPNEELQDQVRRLIESKENELRLVADHLFRALDSSNHKIGD
ncbi:hypothetical protein FBU30_004487 [Linnemannia zychae]|nr:hypothetical protein FBU30_004487 [Linnemannia zychae]